MILLSADLLAQSNTYVGFTGGVNASSVFFNHLAFRTNVRTALQTGTQFGVTLKHFAPLKTGILNTGLQLSVNYSQKGYIQEFPDTRDRADIMEQPDFSTRLNYIEVPFISIIYLGKKKTRYFVSPGIYAEFLVDSKLENLPVDDDAERDFINIGNSNVFPFDREKDNTVGVGGRLEAGIMRDFGFGAIVLGGNFTYTITNTLDFVSRSSGIPDTSNNFTFGVSVGYFIGLGGKRAKPEDLTEE